MGKKRTNDERNHGGSISAGGLESLDELPDLPDLNILLRLGRHVLKEKDREEMISNSIIYMI